ncbi:MAG: hypothetical protein IT449_18945 [Phycisphaerales bacterium]|nr:hypothetical protein [Phycisphaerales bacterium]
MRATRLLCTLVGCACLSLAGAALADDAYYRVPLPQLQLTQGSWPVHEPVPASRYYRMSSVMQPYAILDGEGEAFVEVADAETLFGWATPQDSVERSTLLVKAPRGADLAGHVVIPRPDWTSMSSVRFALPATAAAADAQKPWEHARREHYRNLLSRGLPGAAWFRHQLRTTGDSADDANDAMSISPTRGTVIPAESLEETYAIFSGGRAMSENLQLDRVLPEFKPDTPTVDIDSLTGISVRELNWTALTAGMTPKKDALAALVPADQHAVFFPTFDALVAVTDEAAAQGIPVLRLVDVRSEDARTKARYERQLGLSLTGLGRLLGPHVVRSVALTGSDPYYRTGTDVALLFEAENPEVLRGLLAAQIALTAQGVPNARSTSGEVEGLSYSALISPDRRVCSYLAVLDRTVVVTNSPAQLRRLAEVHKGGASIASLPEYTYFRQRYPLADADESAFLFLSDAAIRRWCGPRWRIATSRRTRASALMAELTAANLDALAAHSVAEGPIHMERPIADVGDLRLTTSGVTSSVHGSLEFLTPIAEVPLTRVTREEADAYARWRESYQRNWRDFFDPIAVRFTTQRDRLAADVSVMPLIAGSEYRDEIALARGAAIAPNAGDRHDALFHLALAVNLQSPPMRQLSDFAKFMTPKLEFNPLGWMGSSVSIYADDGPFWQELAQRDWDDRQQFLASEYFRLPVALRVEVSDSLKLTLFLTAMRAYMDQTTSGLNAWETVTHGERSFVRIGAGPAPGDALSDEPRAWLCYAALPDALIITLNEQVMKDALDRDIARRAAASPRPSAGGAPNPGAGNAPTQGEGSAPTPSAGGAPSQGLGGAPTQGAVGTATQTDDRPWLGTSLCLQMEQKFLDLVGSLTGDHYQVTMMLRAWGNIPVLNEWKRLYPDRDPVQVHESLWQTRLICPGGGSYVWNEEWKTMESTVYGHPASPKPGPPVPPMLKAFRRCNAGLDFEEQGLRARIVLERTTP